MLFDQTAGDAGLPHDLELEVVVSHGTDEGGETSHTSTL